jgi:tRNA threonylcarbamoyladenosine biosynthesis protein TsaB
MKTPRIIAIETSGRQGSVAVARGAELLAEAAFPTDQQHARELLPTLDALCRAQGWPAGSVEHGYISIGPGSFTGLRVAVTFARHLALATGARICAVPTLDVIAENCSRLGDAPEVLAVMLDAKKNLVFAAGFARRPGNAADGFRYERILEPCLIEPSAMLSKLPRPAAVIGEGLTHHEAAMAAVGAIVLDRSLWSPRAANVHKLGWRLAEAGRFTAARELVPFYLRRPEAEELWEKRQGK